LEAPATATRTQVFSREAICHLETPVRGPEASPGRRDARRDTHSRRGEVVMPEPGYVHVLMPMFVQW